MHSIARRLTPRGAAACVVVLLALVVAVVAAGPAQAQRPERAPTFAEVFGTSVSASSPLTRVRFMTFGDAAAAQDREALSQLAAASQCWTVQSSGGNSGWWGYWEYGTRTNWCHNGNVITYRYTQNLPTRAGGLCSASQGTWSYKVGGGTNVWYVDVRSGASFSCYYISGSPWMTVRYTYANSWQYEGSNG
jgi:hypothetical protein